MENILIYGTGDFAKLVSIYLSECYNIVAYTIDRKYMSAESFCDKPVIPFDQIENQFPPSQYGIFVAIGYSNCNQNRLQACKRVWEKNYHCVSYVHPSAIVPAGICVPQNAFIFERVTIQPFSKLGAGTIMWTAASLCHDSCIGSFCFIGAHCCINGFSVIEDSCFLGAGSIIRDHIVVGEESIIGAGCTILESTPPRCVIKAQPAMLLPIPSNTIVI